jgi:hypothetical protein
MYSLNISPESLTKNAIIIIAIQTKTIVTKIDAYFMIYLYTNSFYNIISKKPLFVYVATRFFTPDALQYHLLIIQIENKTNVTFSI